MRTVTGHVSSLGGIVILTPTVIWYFITCIEDASSTIDAAVHTSDLSTDSIVACSDSLTDSCRMFGIAA